MMSGRYSNLLTAHPVFRTTLDELERLGGVASVNVWLNSHPDLQAMSRAEKAWMTRKLKDAGFIKKEGFVSEWKENSNGVKQNMKFNVWRLVRWSH